MRKRGYKCLRAYLGIVILALSACQMELQDVHSGPQSVGLYVGGSETRTEMLPDGLSAVWNAGDELAVWARNSSGSFALSNQVFKTYGIDGQHGFFTSVLAEAMPDDEYTYFCCYPAPVSVDGTEVTFDLPAVQDGKVSGGADIMVSDPVRYGALKPVPDPEDHSGMRVTMNRMMHQFRFYLSEDNAGLGDVEITRMLLDFPKAVAGNVTLDVSDPGSSAVLSNSTGSMTLNLSDPISVSDGQNHEYACVAIAPTSFEAGQILQLKAYTEDKIVLFNPVDLRSRTFKAGHSTPVRLLIKELVDYGRIRFTVSGNNLGEDADSVILTLPSGYTWGDTGSNVYTYSPGHKITTGETFEIVFEDIDQYRSLSGQTVIVTYDTEHVNTSLSYVLPDLASMHMAEISSVLPYLLYEDFSTVGSFSSSDEYSEGFNTGSKSAYSFLDGWTGGRIGAEASKSIRIAPRRETSANYHARVDSAPIISLKKEADVSVSFDFGANNKYGGLAIITDGNVGQTFFVGYVTSSDAYKSGDDDGVFEDGNSRYVKEYTGSYDNTPNADTYVLHSVPSGLVRISWRSEIESQAGTTNTTCWLYIDNVKVQIAQ